MLPSFCTVLWRAILKNTLTQVNRAGGDATNAAPTVARNIAHQAIIHGNTVLFIRAGPGAIALAAGPDMAWTNAELLVPMCAQSARPVALR
jgi:hypothetical protein